MKKITGGVVARIFTLILSGLLQAALLIIPIIFFRSYFAYFYVAFELLALGETLYIVRQNSTPEYKIAWLIPILLLPIFGGMLYLVFRRSRTFRSARKRDSDIKQKSLQALRAQPYAASVQKAEYQLAKEHADAAIQSHYIAYNADAPVFTGTQVRYFPLGDDLFAQMLIDIENAQRFIFMEYFIVQSGKLWDTLLEVLVRKAKEGVDVRFMYDDLGCLFLLPGNYAKLLEAQGIKCCVFNHFTNIFSSRFINRNHRKICVIDGNVAYTGGVNLADEYINVVEKYGHWKDTGVRLEGAAVWSFTVMFLGLWGYVRGTDEDFLPFAPTKTETDDGYVQPYMDSPMDDEPVGENVYKQIVNRSKRYVYIMTPYLIIDRDMINTLTEATKSGIDVRLITPGIPDKKIVYLLTRSYYEVLLRAGARIFEYTPGFVHAKSFVSDDVTAVVGTINLDYRSLFLHFECAVWMHRSAAVCDVRDDFLATQTLCREVTLESCPQPSWFKRAFLSVLRIFAPLL